jgi:hypothetical protein
MIFDFTTVFLCSFTLVQVAILTLLEGENALLELKAGDDAAKARCSPAVIHSSNSKSHIWNDRWVDYERGLPMFASHAHFMEAAIRYLVNPDLSTGYQPKFANFNLYSTTEKRHMSSSGDLLQRAWSMPTVKPSELCFSRHKNNDMTQASGISKMQKVVCSRADLLRSSCAC